MSNSLNFVSAVLLSTSATVGSLQQAVGSLQQEAGYLPVMSNSLNVVSTALLSTSLATVDANNKAVLSSNTAAYASNLGADGAVTTPKNADGAVTMAKIGPPQGTVVATLEVASGSLAESNEPFHMGSITWSGSSVGLDWVDSNAKDSLVYTGSNPIYMAVQGVEWAQNWPIDIVPVQWCVAVNGSHGRTVETYTTSPVFVL